MNSIRDVDDVEAHVIAHLDAANFTIDCIRDDIKPRYSDTDLDEAYRLIMANQVSSDDFKIRVALGLACLKLGDTIETPDAPTTYPYGDATAQYASSRCYSAGS